MKIILIGPPGAGKGTVSSFLVEKYGLTHVSTGEVLRKAIDEGTELGKLAQSLIDKGEFIPDNVAVAIVKAALQEVNDYVLDGFPRNAEQALIFDDMLKENDDSLDFIIQLELEDEHILKRLLHRRECEGCRATYHLVSFPPNEKGVCDHCGKNLVVRKDDNNVEKRLQTYREKTIQVAEHYEKKGKVHKIYTGKSIKEIVEEIKNVIDTQGGRI